MSTKQRDAAYVALFTVNAALVACVQQGILPGTWVHYVNLGSLLMTTLMKQFGADDAAKPEAK